MIKACLLCKRPATFNCQSCNYYNAALESKFDKDVSYEKSLREMIAAEHRILVTTARCLSSLSDLIGTVCPCIGSFVGGNDTSCSNKKCYAY